MCGTFPGERALRPPTNFPGTFPIPQPFPALPFHFTAPCLPKFPGKIFPIVRLIHPPSSVLLSSDADHPEYSQ